MSRRRLVATLPVCVLTSSDRALWRPHFHDFPALSGPATATYPFHDGLYRKNHSLGRNNCCSPSSAAYTNIGLSGGIRNPAVLHTSPDRIETGQLVPFFNSSTVSCGALYLFSPAPQICTLPLCLLCLLSFYSYTGLNQPCNLILDLLIRQPY